MKRLVLATSIALPMAVGVMGLNCGGGTTPGTGTPGSSSGSSGGGPSSSGSGSGSPGGSSGGSSGDNGSSSSGGSSGNSSGSSGSSGSSSGSGGGSSSGSSGSSSGGGDAGAGPMDVLNNQQWLLPCGPDQSYSKLVCANNGTVGTYSATNYGGHTCGTITSAGNLTAGTVNRDQTVTVGGNPATTYMVTAHFQGIVEPKVYINGTKPNATVATDGWYVGGLPRNSGSYNVYMLGVSSPQQVYYLNGIGNSQPAIAEFHYSYLIDYSATFPVQGGAKVRFLADDSNCSAIKNCGTAGSNDAAGICVGIVIPNLVATPPIDQRGTQGYSGQFVVMTITSVSPPM
jgi:hypothetical protein